MTEGTMSPRAQPRVEAMKLLEDLIALEGSIARVGALVRLQETEQRRLR